MKKKLVIVALLFVGILFSANAVFIKGTSSYNDGIAGARYEGTTRNTSIEEVYKKDLDEELHTANGLSPLDIKPFSGNLSRS